MVVHSPTVLQDSTFTDLVIYSENISDINSNVYGVDIIWEGPCFNEMMNIKFDVTFKKRIHIFNSRPNLVVSQLDINVKERKLS